MGYKPSWRFGKLDFEGPFGWGGIGGLEVYKEIRERLKNFEGMTWGEIVGGDNHFIKVKSMCKDAKSRLTEIGQDDIDEMFSLRFTGKKRLLGIREADILYIVWWDPEHQICPAIKKHT